MTEPSRADIGTSKYEAVVAHEAYRSINRTLVRMSRVAPSSAVVDLGCGTGAVAEQVLADSPRCDVWLVDPDEAMLLDAERRLGSRVKIARGRAEDIEHLLEPSSIDVILMGNCIHLINDIGGTLVSIRRVLRDNGRLAFNTAFFEGSEDPSERHLYWEVLVTARRLLRETGRETPTRLPRPLAKRALSRSLYETQLRANGFIPQQVSLDRVALERSMILDVLAAPVFAEGALPGIDGSLAAEIMTRAAMQVLEHRQVDDIHRTWMTIVAIATQPEEANRDGGDFV